MDLIYYHGYTFVFLFRAVATQALLSKSIAELKFIGTLLSPMSGTSPELAVVPCTVVHAAIVPELQVGLLISQKWSCFLWQVPLLYFHPSLSDMYHRP